MEFSDPQLQHDRVVCGIDGSLCDSLVAMTGTTQSDSKLKDFLERSTKSEDLHSKAVRGSLEEKRTKYIGTETKPGHSNALTTILRREPCLYDHETFKKAAVLFDALKPPPTDDPLALQIYEGKRRETLLDVQYSSDLEKRVVLTLVFSTLKCK